MKDILSYIVKASIRIARILSIQIRRRIPRIKRLLHTCARALQQPHIQYRMALFLVTILAFLLGWSLFLVALPHTTFALVGHI